MDDILILSSGESEGASLWVKYYKNCFEQYSIQKGRPVPKIMKLALEELTKTEINQSLQERILGVKLQLLVVCPRFLDLIEQNPIASATFGKCLRPDRTIAMLLGVTDESFTKIHLEALPSYRQWQRHIVGQDQDEDFTKEFLTAAINILTKVARQEQQQAIEERTTFSVMPKKVKQSQNRLIILLAEPLTKDDVVKVSVDKNGDMIEIKSVKRRNPYTLKFVMPESCLEVSLIVNVLVEKNGDLLGARPVKCESRLRELDQILRSSDNPLEFMCQTLGFSPSSRDQLDHWLVHNFQKNVPADFNLLNSLNPCSVDSVSPVRHAHGHEEYPTLLHFAARFGLERLSWQLLECPGGDMAMDVRNVCDLTPAEIAEAAGHQKLASTLSGYMKMNEFTNMYSKLKEMAQGKEIEKPCVEQPEEDDDLYLVPRPADSSYCIPPAAVPVNPQPNTPRFNSGPYMDMQPNTGRNPASNKGTLPRNRDPDSGYNSNSATMNRLQSFDSTDSNHSNQPAKNHQICEDKVQGELLEIMNDFKNNIHSIGEVEQLVDKWRNRNDLINYQKNKTEELNKLRQEYERLQQKMKDEMKRPTPFERFKNIFFRNKDTGCEDKKFNKDITGGDEKVLNFINSNNLRPISTLSLQSTTSSSSSGRMSTISGCSAASFGDSGTHSDHEERKQLMRQTSSASDHEYHEIPEHMKKAQSFGSYLIPPAPKPVNTKFSTTKSPAFAQQFTTINERPPHPVPRVDPAGSEHYIRYPPSGKPVNGSFTNELNSKLGNANIQYPLDDTQSEYLEVENPDEDQSEYIDAEQPEYINDEESEYMNNYEQPEYINNEEQTSCINEPKIPPGYVDMNQRKIESEELPSYEEPVQDYMNLGPNGNPIDEQPDYCEAEYCEAENNLPDYMNYKPRLLNKSPFLPPRKS